MRKGLLTALMALLVCGSVGLAYASGHDAEAANAASDGDPAAASATDPGQDVSGGTSPRGEAKSDADLISRATVRASVPKVLPVRLRTEVQHFRRGKWHATVAKKS
jgi:hypothetical protein